MKKLWDKGGTLDKAVENFTVGRDRELDGKLAVWDIIGSAAHAVMLGKANLISREDLDILLPALEKMYLKAAKGKLIIEDGIEDIHSQVEHDLTIETGSTGKKIHTGRSRNDQVLTDLRLFYRYETCSLAQKTIKLAHSLLKKGRLHKDILMPGYTHMQIAMVSSFGLWFTGWAEGLADDLTILASSFSLNNHSPLGSAAGYGTNLPIDREYTASILCFDELTTVSAYAQFSRVKNDLALTNSLASIASTLAGMASDLITFSGQNFNFFTLSEEHTTGSSIMPQKKNPDILELIRAKCNILKTIPSQVSLLASNLNSGYHRDYQLLKEIVFPAIEMLSECIDMVSLVCGKININKTILDNNIYQPLLSTNMVNDMVKEGVPFRDAYKQVAAVIDNTTFTCPDISDYTHTGSIGNPGFSIIENRLSKAEALFDSPGPGELLNNILNKAGKTNLM